MNQLLACGAYNGRMNAHTAISSHDDVQWSAAQECVNAWRGKCLHAYGTNDRRISGENVSWLTVALNVGPRPDLPVLAADRFDLHPDVLTMPIEGQATGMKKV
jgi:hypothetical protein